MEDLVLFAMFAFIAIAFYSVRPKKDSSTEEGAEVTIPAQSGKSSSKRS